MAGPVRRDPDGTIIMEHWRDIRGARVYRALRWGRDGGEVGLSGSRDNRIYLGCPLEATGSPLQRLDIPLTFPSM